MKQCLVIIDLQNDYFPGGAMELVAVEEAAENARRLLTAFRAKGLPVVHIQHLSVRPGATFFLPDTPGAEIHEAVQPLAGERVVTKYYPNSFRETSLLDVLREEEITELVVCGAMSHMCIDTTVRAAFDLGFSCVVAEDACATRDLTFGDRTVKAADVHASFMAALSVPFARVVRTGSLLKDR